MLLTDELPKEKPNETNQVKELKERIRSLETEKNKLYEMLQTVLNKK